MDLHKAALLAHIEGLTAEFNQNAALHLQVKLLTRACQYLDQAGSMNKLLMLRQKLPKSFQKLSTGSALIG